MENKSITKIHNFNILEHVSSDFHHINFDNFDEDTIIEEFKNIYIKTKESEKSIKEKDIKYLYITSMFYSYFRFLTILKKTPEGIEFFKNNKELISYIDDGEYNKKFDEELRHY